MKKILVNIFVPILGVDYDVFIPNDSKMSEVAELLKRAVVELSDGQFIVSSATAICMCSTGAILDINHTVYELGIKNGSKLMII